MSGSAPVPRPHRTRDMAIVARALAAQPQKGTFILNGVDLNATDLGSRGAAVEAIARACRALSRMRRERYWAYSYPLHAQLSIILERERAELAALVQQEAAV